MRVFEYVAVWHQPNTTTGKHDELDEHVLLTEQPVLIIAPDEAGAKKRAIRDVALEPVMAIDDVEVLVRPFA